MFPKVQVTGGSEYLLHNLCKLRYDTVDSCSLPSPPLIQAGCDLPEGQDGKGPPASRMVKEDEIKSLHPWDSESSALCVSVFIVSSSALNIHVLRCYPQSILFSPH